MINDMNTPKNKIKLFFQYHGQKVLEKDGRLFRHRYFLANYYPDGIDDWTLRLKRPNMSFTDNCIPSSACDKLRDYGYACPWHGISIQDQLDWGWLKFEEA